jgi:hypothetical protein
VLLFLSTPAIALGCGGRVDLARRAPASAPDAGETTATSPLTLATKVDLLFTIDNSASMADKQTYLEQAVPELIARLVTPRCVSADDPRQVLGVSHDDGVCDHGQIEFRPVRDLHVGVVSTSLGPRLGDLCDPNEAGHHNDDGAHLLNRAGDDEHPLPAAAPGSFLAWFPTVAANQGHTPSPGATPIVDLAAFEDDAAALAFGAHQTGCGIESQLESWYRFLIQPDPYGALGLNGTKAEWRGVDTTILQQRHDFLRPDSLVAIILLTDEDDSEIDVRALGGQGYDFMSSAFAPPRGTAACAADPGDPACTSCAFVDAGSSDPSCVQGRYTSPTDWGYDPNLRHVHMKAKYGVDPQYPITRYVNGLTSLTVPDRFGEYPPGAGSYIGENDCTNPLYAAALPDGSSTSVASLCHIPPAAHPRGQNLVFFGTIGGVPHELLHFTPGDPDASTLTDADWVKILGRDPEGFDVTGIDPHMVESVTPRAGLAPPSSSNDADAISGREWITDQGPHVDLLVDRQYACTFPLTQARDCSLAANRPSCDCSATGLTHAQTSPVCDPANANLQVRAKAYPTIRELLLAKKLGPQGVAASICPIHTVEASPGDPLYGYRPAVETLVARFASALPKG